MPPKILVSVKYVIFNKTKLSYQFNGQALTSNTVVCIDVHNVYQLPQKNVFEK